MCGRVDSRWRFVQRSDHERFHPKRQSENKRERKLGNRLSRPIGKKRKGGEEIVLETERKSGGGIVVDQRRCFFGSIWRGGEGYRVPKKVDANPPENCVLNKSRRGKRALKRLGGEKSLTVRTGLSG